MASREHSHHRKGKHSSRKHHSAPEPVKNKFANDGSFIEMWKKMLEQNSKTAAPATTTNAPTASAVSGSSSLSSTPASSSSSSQKDAVPTFSSITGKRRGPPTLKTGMVKKVKHEEAEESSSDNKDKWSKYLDEVKRIKEQLCIEGEENRPLVK